MSNGIDHDGWYNPWDELKKPEVKAAYDAAVATGGFAYRTGTVRITPGKVSIAQDGSITFGEPRFWHQGDGLRIVRFEKNDAPKSTETQAKSAT